jgi:hypothetical protein
MDDRDRYDSPYDRNEDRRFGGRDERGWQDQQNRGSREWDRSVRDWERSGRDDGSRGEGRDFRQHNELRGQHNELRGQGRGFRDDDYGSARQDGDRQLSQRDGSYREGAYSGPTGSYMGYRDDRQDWGSTRNAQHQDWGRDSAREGYYGGGQRLSGSQRDAYQQQQNQGGPRGFSSTPSYGGSSFGSHSEPYGGSARYGARSFEAEGSRGEYQGRHEDSFGQQLRDAGSHMLRSVKRVFRGPKGYKRSDERIREDVSDRLAQQDQVDPSDIEVQVQNGEVTLTGTVQSRHEKFLAEELADDVSGVTDVHNQLRLKRDNVSSDPRSSASSNTATTQTESAQRVRNGRV